MSSTIGGYNLFLQKLKGSTTEILLYGATVISWKAASLRDTQPTERLFVSSKAALDGSKPVRGGIPVVFPCFGAPAHAQHINLRQHGFARNSIWKYDGVVMDNEAGVSVRLILEPNEKISAIYTKQFHLAYVVTLAEHQLSTDLHVTNTSASPDFPPDTLDFQALFHNYILAPADKAMVTPLTGLKYIDKTAPTEEERTIAKIESRAAVDVKKSTDSVYEHAPQKYELSWPGGGIEVKSVNLKDVVVWNPQAEVGSKIGDMEPAGWEKYVCLEPGHVRGFVKLEPGRKWTGQQVLSVIHEERRMS